MKITRIEKEATALVIESEKKIAALNMLCRLREYACDFLDSMDLVIEEKDRNGFDLAKQQIFKVFQIVLDEEKK